ncbi:MAG: hypothetical protein ABIJ09_18225 [Pseudomonadota bacterium]
MRHTLRRVAGSLVLSLLAVACTNRMASEVDCTLDDSCQVPFIGDYLACTADAECPSGMCGRDGLCVGTQQCFVTAECPSDMYCNIALSSPVCAPLGPGACREASHCLTGVCSAVGGGLGTCLECLVHGDCASGTCNLDGTCAAESSTATLTCPAHAHADGDICVCDEGWVMESSSTACVEQSPEPPITTPEPTPSGDTCELAGLYGDGSCDPGCPQPDPDCEPDLPLDECAEYGYYGDGECDTWCDEPDPDCSAQGSGDICADRGYYDDGVCDTFCAEPDPDCRPQQGDRCGDVTYYGYCDDDTLIYCYQNRIDIVECTGTHPHCGLVSEQTGYDCLATSG